MSGIFFLTAFTTVFTQDMIIFVREYNFHFMRTNSLLRKIPLFLIVSLFALCNMNAQTTPTEHIVKAGETLYGIASMYNTNVNALKNANSGISDNIAVGQRLIIPTVRGTQIFHTIAAKETLFSISRKYNVEISKITNANPGLNEQNFKAGTTIIIPADNFAETKVDTAPAHSEGIAGSNCREMYKVKKKDTFFTIAKKFDLTVDELAAANPDVSASGYNIQKGDYICIPFAVDKSQIINNQQAFEQAGKAAPKNTVHISLLMPFYENGADAKKSFVFYRGLLAAADSLRKSGISFDITAKDAGTSVADINKTLSDGSLDSSDLLIASADEAQLNAIADYCKNKKIRLYLPFNSEFGDVFNNPQIILAQQPKSYEQVSAIQYFISKYGEYNIIYIDCNTQQGRNNYIDQLLPSLKLNGKTYTTVNIEASDDILLRAFNPAKRNAIVLSSSSKNSFKALAKRLDNIASSISSMDYFVFGHKEWTDFELATRNTFFKYDVTILTPQYINVFSPCYAQYLSYYKSNFKQTPSSSDQRTFFLGFDSGMYLLGLISSYGPTFNTQTIRTVPIEKPISYTRVNNWSGMINKAYRVVRFTKSHTTEITDHAQ